MTIRILVADDHPVVRSGLRALLSSQPDFEVVADAEDGEAASTLAASHTPDVVLMDLQMPVLDGLAAIQRIHTRQPNASANPQPERRRPPRSRSQPVLVLVPRAGSLCRVSAGPPPKGRGPAETRQKLFSARGLGLLFGPRTRKGLPASRTRRRIVRGARWLVRRRARTGVCPTRRITRPWRIPRARRRASPRPPETDHCGPPPGSPPIERSAAPLPSACPC